jgi:hypothetical protein
LRTPPLLLQILGVITLLTGCSSTSTGEGDTSAAEALAGTGPLGSDEILGTLSCGQTISASYTGTPAYGAYELTVAKGTVVDVSVAGSLGVQTDAWLLRSTFSEVTSAAGIPDAHLTATIARTGNYYVAFKNKPQKPETLTVTLACSTPGDAGAADSGPPDSGAQPTYPMLPLGPVSLAATVSLPGVVTYAVCADDSCDSRNVYSLDGTSQLACTFTGSNPGTVGASCEVALARPDPLLCWDSSGGCTHTAQDPWSSALTAEVATSGAFTLGWSSPNGPNGSVTGSLGRRGVDPLSLYVDGLSEDALVYWVTGKGQGPLATTP